MGLFSFFKNNNSSPEFLKDPGARKVLMQADLEFARKHITNLQAVGREEDAKEEITKLILKYAKRPKEPSTKRDDLARVSYYISYFLLPEIVFERWAEFSDLWNSWPPFPWFLAIQGSSQAGIRIKFEEIQEFKKYEGDLDVGEAYFLIEYPKPPDNDSAALMENLLANIDKIKNFQQMHVLGPYFSLIVANHKTNTKKLYVLAQSPLGGVTTVRHVSGVGVHGNCGPGPQPDAATFLGFVLKMLQSERGSSPKNEKPRSDSPSDVINI